MAEGDDKLTTWFRSHGVHRRREPRSVRFSIQPTDRELPDEVLEAPAFPDIHDDLDLSGENFEEPVDLTGLRIYGSVRLRCCLFEAPVILRGAWIAGDVELGLSRICPSDLETATEECHDLFALILSRAQIEGKLEMRGLQIGFPVNHEIVPTDSASTEPPREIAKRRRGAIQAVGTRIRGGIDARVHMVGTHLGVRNPDPARMAEIGLMPIGDPSDPIGYPLWIGNLNMGDAWSGARVDFGGARFEGSFRMQRAALDGTLALEWRSHHRLEYEKWVKLADEENELRQCAGILSLDGKTLENLDSLRTIIRGKLDLDRISMGGSLMGRGLWVGDDVILAQAEIAGSAMFRAWHAHEREEVGLDHTIHMPSAATPEPGLTTLALRSFFRRLICARQAKIGNLLNLTGAEVGRDLGSKGGISLCDAIDLHRSKLGALSLGTWRRRDWSPWDSPFSAADPISQSLASRVTMDLPNGTSPPDPKDLSYLSSIVWGHVRLSDVRIEGSARFNGAAIQGTITVHGLKVGAQFDLQSFVITRRENDLIRVANVPFGWREIDLAKTLPRDAEDPECEAVHPYRSLRGNDVKIGGSLQMNGSRFRGGVYLRACEIGGSLEANVRGPIGAELRTCFGGVANLATPRAQNEPAMESSLRLPFCRFGSDLTMRGAQLESCLSLYAATFAGGIDAGPWIYEESQQIHPILTSIGRGRVSSRMGPSAGYVEDVAPTNPLNGGLEASGLVSVKMDYLRTGGDVCFDMPQIEAPLSAQGARISGSVYLRGGVDARREVPPTRAHVPTEPMLYALDFNGASIGRDFVVSNIDLGAVTLLRADIGGSVRFESRTSGNHAIDPYYPDNLFPPSARPPGDPGNDERRQHEITHIVERIRSGPIHPGVNVARHVIGAVTRNGRTRSLVLEGVKIRGSFEIIGYRLLSGIFMACAEIEGVVKLGSPGFPIVVGIGRVQTPRSAKEFESREYSLWTRSARFGADVWLFDNVLFGQWNHSLAKVAGNIHLHEISCPKIDLSESSCATFLVRWPEEDALDLTNPEEQKRREQEIPIWLWNPSRLINKWRIPVGTTPESRSARAERLIATGRLVWYGGSTAFLGLLALFMMVPNSLHFYQDNDYGRLENWLLIYALPCGLLLYLAYVVRAKLDVSLGVHSLDAIERDLAALPQDAPEREMPWALYTDRVRPGAYFTRILTSGFSFSSLDGAGWPSIAVNGQGSPVTEALFPRHRDVLAYLQSRDALIWTFLGGLATFVVTATLLPYDINVPVALFAFAFAISIFFLLVYAAIGRILKRLRGGADDRFSIVFLHRTEFDAGFYAKVEKELQSSGKSGIAGQVSRMLQRRRFSQGVWGGGVSNRFLHALFGHGTRMFPILVAYVLLALTTWGVFSQVGALEDTRDRASARISALTDYQGTLDGLASRAPTKEKAALLLQKDRVMEAGLFEDPASRIDSLLGELTVRDAAYRLVNTPYQSAIEQKRALTRLQFDLVRELNEAGGLREKKVAEAAPDGHVFENGMKLPSGTKAHGDLRNAIGPTLRTLVPFATFEAGAGASISDRQIPVIEHFRRALIGKLLTAQKGRAIKYSEFATLVTLVSWLLIPIFLIRLVTSMRRLEVKDFEG